MDRTKEFYTIVRATEIPQPSYKRTPFYANIASKYEEIKVVLLDLERLTTYESFKMMPKLVLGYDLIREYKLINIEDNKDGDYQECVNALKSMVNSNAMKATLRLNEFSRKCNNLGSKMNNSNNRNSKNNNVAIQEECGSSHKESSPSDNGMSVMLIDETKQQISQESIQERRRIVRSISEIGQIVEDISIHVSLQEEQLRRIDDSLIKTEKWNKKALNELIETWEIARENRPFMIKFFIFWAIVFLMFWLLKKS